MVCVWACVRVCVYLIDGDVVAWLLEAGHVVVAVAHHDADLMQDHCAKRVSTLHLHHQGLDGGGGLGTETHKVRQSDG